MLPMKAGDLACSVLNALNNDSSIGVRHRDYSFDKFTIRKTCSVALEFRNERLASINDF